MSSLQHKNTLYIEEAVDEYIWTEEIKQTDTVHKKITVTFPKWELLLFKAEGTYSIPMFLKTF